MKLDDTVIRKIIEEGIVGTVDERELRKFLMNLDLIFKSGDSSQSILVENGGWQPVRLED